MDASACPDFARISEDYWRTRACDTFEKSTEFFRKELPDKTSRDAYHTWLGSQQPLRPKPVTSQYLIDLLKSMNFITDYGQLLSVLQRGGQPHIPIGIIDGTSYRLSPEPFCLIPENDPRHPLQANTSRHSRRQVQPQLESAGAVFPPNMLSVCLASLSSFALSVAARSAHGLRGSAQCIHPKYPWRNCRYETRNRDFSFSF